MTCGVFKGREISPMLRITGLAMAASLYLAGMAVAQDEPPPTPAEITAAHTEADRIIVADNAADVFENATTSDLVVVRHRSSGLLCHFIGDQGLDRLTVIPSGPETGERRGNDVACSTFIGDIELTLYITRYADDHSAEEDTQLAVDAIADRFTDLKPHPDDLPILSGPDGEPSWAAFDVTAGGRDLMTFVATTKIGGWMVKVRASGPVEDADHVSTLATLLVMRAQPD
jgi:hypothetical protein